MPLRRNSNGTISKVLQLKTATAIFAVAVLCMVVAPSVVALDTGIEYGTATGLGTQDIRVTVMKIIRIALGLVGIIAIIIVIYAGFIWMTSAGNPEKIDTAKRTLRNAVIGLIIIFSAFAIVSFIIGALERATIGGEGVGGAPPGACENCGHLGAGIIERVYPPPFARDVARNTNIMVTFKVTMKPNTIIVDAPDVCSADSLCTGDVVSSNILIFPNTDDEDDRLANTKVVATSIDGKTFIFNPVDYLGDGIKNEWYSVKLTNGIRKDNGERAFAGVNSYFLWRFEIGTFLDLDPVEVGTLFPQPDNQGDSYARVDAVQAIGSITVNGLPQVNVAAATSNVTKIPESAIDGTINGNYNCSIDTSITIGKQTGGNFTITSIVPVPGLNTQLVLSGGAINLGCGLTLSFASTPADGSQWSFNATAARVADTLRIDSRTYTFVSGTAGNNQISRASTVGEQATAIAAKITSDNLAVGAQAVDSTVSLIAKVAGSAGNSIVLQTSGAWAQIAPMSGGDNASFRPTTRDIPDKPRNAVIAIDFNEAIDPNLVNSDTITIQYDINPDSDLETDWTTVVGKYLVSNQYRTVEFLSDNACVDADGQPIANACGEAMYCLPVNRGTCSVTTNQQCDITIECPSGETCQYKATHYRVSIKAGALKLCSSPTDCTDPSFNACLQTLGGGGSVCQGTFNINNVDEGVWFPEANSATPAGIIDAANNSFNGNRTTYTLSGQIMGRADGPESQSDHGPYNANSPQAGKGDDHEWYFFINKNIKLSPPVLTEIGPTIAATTASIIDPAHGTFDGVMMSASLKPGSNYRDGQCGCGQDSDCNQSVGESCDLARGKCVDDTDQQFCEQDTECGTDTPVCINKKYVSLVDRSTSPVGWWVTKDSLDTVFPLDSFADQSKAFLNHTRFAEVTSYGAEIGSGVKDIYQNCYLPSGGPGSDIPPSCNVSASLPYCCNGSALSKADWARSECFTGY